MSGHAVTERFSMVPSSLLEHSGLKGREKVVIVALLSFCDRAGVCFPSLSRLAKTAGLSKATVARSLLYLEARGVLTRKRRMSPEGDFTSTLYTLGRLSQIETTLSQADTTLSHGETGVVSNCDNGLSQIETLTDSLEQTHRTDESGEKPELSPSKEVYSKPSLKTEPTDKDQEPLDGRQSPEDFERTCRKFFEEFIRAYPKPGAGSKKSYAIFKGLFSPEGQHFERNADRFQNIMGATIAYGRTVDPEAPRFIRSAERFLSELDADLPVEEETTRLVRKTA